MDSPPKLRPLVGILDAQAPSSLLHAEEVAAPTPPPVPMSVYESGSGPRRLNLAINRLPPQRRVPALVIVCPPLMNAQLIQYQLIKKYPALFTATSGVAPNGLRYGQPPPGVFYMRQAFEECQRMDCRATILDRSVMLLPAMLASSTARAEQLVARERVNRDNLAPMAQRAFELMMQVDTDAMGERLRSAEAERLDENTNWNYRETEPLTEKDNARRNAAIRDAIARDDFIRMARTLMGVDESTFKTEQRADGAHVSPDTPSSWHTRAWVERELATPADEPQSVSSNRIEVLVGDSVFDGAMVEAFESLMDTAGESQLLSAYDAARQVEASRFAATLDPESIVYLVVSAPFSYFHASIACARAHFTSMLPLTSYSHGSVQRVIDRQIAAFYHALDNVTRMSAAYSALVQEWITEPAGRRIVVFNTDEVPSSVEQQRGEFWMARAPVDRAMSQYYPVLIDVCTDQFDRVFGGRGWVYAKPETRKFFNYISGTVVAISHMQDTLLTLIGARYADADERLALDDELRLLARTRESDAGIKPAEDVAFQDRSDYVTIVDPPSHLHTPPPERISPAVSVQIDSDSDDTDQEASHASHPSTSLPYDFYRESHVATDVFAGSVEGDKFYSPVPPVSQ